jgi:hypothetical protein
MAILKLSYNPWTKGSNCLLFKDNKMIALLLKKNEKIVLPPNKSRMTN